MWLIGGLERGEDNDHESNADDEIYVWVLKNIYKFDSLMRDCKHSLLFYDWLSKIAEDNEDNDAGDVFFLTM